MTASARGTNDVSPLFYSSRLKLVVAVIALSSSSACASLHSAKNSFSPARDYLSAEVTASTQAPVGRDHRCTYKFGYNVGTLALTSESEYAAGDYLSAISDARLIKRAVGLCSVSKGVLIPAGKMYADDVLMKSYIAKGQREEALRYSQEALSSSNDILSDPSASVALREAASRSSQVAKALDPSK